MQLLTIYKLYTSEPKVVKNETWYLSQPFNVAHFKLWQNFYFNLQKQRKTNISLGNLLFSSVLVFGLITVKFVVQFSDRFDIYLKQCYLVD